MNEELRNIVTLYKTAMSLKELPRQGWIMEGALRSETDTVAAHSFCVALISYLTARAIIERFPGIDTERVAIMAIFHDLGESATGEIATAIKRWITKNFTSENLVEKMEHDLLNSLVNDVVGGKEIKKLVEEFDECNSKEAKIVKFADALDAFAHAKVRLKKTFTNYLKKVSKKLSRESNDDPEGELGKLLVYWLKEVKKNWENPKWDMKRPWKGDCDGR
jgi:putative hydrolase of HD superfamily